MIFIVKYELNECFKTLFPFHFNIQEGLSVVLTTDIQGQLTERPVVGESILPPLAPHTVDQQMALLLR